MYRALNPLEPPGEDSFDVPEPLGWLVGACTWVRNLIVACGDMARRAREPQGAWET